MCVRRVSHLVECVPPPVWVFDGVLVPSSFRSRVSAAAALSELRPASSGFVGEILLGKEAFAGVTSVIADSA